MTVELVCLVADKCIGAVMEALLEKRRPALGLRGFTFEVRAHPDRDPGCYNTGAELLRDLVLTHDCRGLMVFDRAWDGNPHDGALDTEKSVRDRFSPLGIEAKAEVVVIEPELEAWVWSGSRHVEEILGWKGADPNLRAWLEDQGIWAPRMVKPHDPKAAVEAALLEKRIPRSSSIYRKLAEKVSLHQCRDSSFQRLCAILKRWFSE